MTSHAGFTAPADAAQFILGGNAIFTMTSARTGAHFTYKVQLPQNADSPSTTPWFVRVLREYPDSWTYIGFIPRANPAMLIAGRNGAPDGESFKALAWALKHLDAGNLPEQLQIQHMGSCGMCNRPLTDPTSISIGIGPICREKLS